jgi:ABC-2 type transport system ATP-binding protein
MRKFGKKQLTLTLRQPMTRIPAGLNAWSLALSADGHFLIYNFDTQQEENGIAALLHTLAEQHIEFKDLSSSESSLEDIFVSLVHQSKQAPA